MHFFHPIQQCAQQIYYTALPLSPTSSQLQKSCLQSVVDDQLSYVTAFVGAPSTWGLLLRTIDTRPRKVTCIATSGQMIIAACGNVVNIYDAVTGVLQQSLSPSEVVKKIQVSPDGSTLFFAHSLSITMWDVQTGGLAYTFTAQSEINDILLSETGDYVACGSSDGSVTFWNTRNKQEGKGFRNDQPAVAMCWVSPQNLAVATHNTIYSHSITTGETQGSFPFPDRVWGVVYLKDKENLLVGTSKAGPGNVQLCSLETISHRRPPLERTSAMVHCVRFVRWKMHLEKQSPTHSGSLAHPTIVGKEIMCITTPSGVQLFSTESYDWSNKPPLLGGASFVAVSLNRNLVVQTEDSIQIFSTDVLTSRDVHAHDHVRTSHVYPLGHECILCLQQNRHLALLALETLREIHPEDETVEFTPFLDNELQSARAVFYPGQVANFDFAKAIRSWKQRIPIPEGSESAGGQIPRVLCALSPARTRVLIVAAGTLRITSAGRGSILATLDVGNFGGGEAYDITFDSETRFHLKVDGPDKHFKVPCDIETNTLLRSAASPYPLSIIKGQPEPLSEPRVTPYALDVNCEWVLDAKSRKICWIPPGNVRRGDDGHLWIGTALVMVGDDGVVRKVTFKEPDC